MTAPRPEVHHLIRLAGGRRTTKCGAPRPRMTPDRERAILAGELTECPDCYPPDPPPPRRPR